MVTLENIKREELQCYWRTWDILNCCLRQIKFLEAGCKFFNLKCALELKSPQNDDTYLFLELMTRRVLT